MGCLSSTFAKEVVDAVHVEGKGETKGLVEWVALSRRNHVTSIEGEDVHLEACSNGVVGTVTLVGVFVVITSTKEELVVVGVFESDAPLDFLHLFLKTIGSIVEGLEDTTDRRHVEIALAFKPGTITTIIFFVVFRLATFWRCSYPIRVGSRDHPG